MPKLAVAVKRILVGRPQRSDRLAHSLLPKRTMNATRQPAACSRARTGCPTQSSCSGSGRSATVPLGSRHAEATPSGRSIRISRSVVHGTVATVGMPRRSYTAARLAS